MTTDSDTIIALSSGALPSGVAIIRINGPKTSPAEIVACALDGLEAGLDEVLADERTRLVKQGLSAASASYLPQRAA